MKHEYLARRAKEEEESFPGLLGRGLIEARRRGPATQPPCEAFPGLLGRGLIEARVAARARGSDRVFLSPVYWAGASLKHGHPWPSGATRGGLSPVYWAGASLKREVVGLPRRPIVADFPRSTGPGPH